MQKQCDARRRGANLGRCLRASHAQQQMLLTRGAKADIVVKTSKREPEAIGNGSYKYRHS